MKADIFSFWRKMPRGATVHPDDAAVVQRASHGFDLTAIPHGFTGPLRHAKVVLLSLSPGYHPFDSEFAISNEGKDWHSNQWSGSGRLPTIEEHPPGASWWRKIVKQFGVDPTVAEGQLAILNLGAYHSVGFSDWHMLSALPSSRVAVGWAQDQLFPEAERGSRVVVCLRSAKYWGLSAGRYGKGLFVPTCTRGGFIHRGEERTIVAEAVSRALA